MAKEPKSEWVPFGAEVRKHLERRGMSQKRLAEALGWQESKVSEILNGRTIPKDQDVADLEGALDGAGGQLRPTFERCRNGDDTPPFEEVQQVAEALRPFRILAELRLSTLYRTATVLLGGAALMLLIPLIFPDAPARLLGAIGRATEVSSTSALLLGLGMCITFAVPVWGFIMIIADLAGFFFTGHRFDVAAEGEGAAVFNPRLALPGMLAPSGDLPGWSYALLREKRLEQLGILLPLDDEWRQAFDDRMRRIFHLEPSEELSDESRIGYAFRLSVSVPRTLLDEAAKVELSLAKHILLLRVCLMRFLKTLLLVPVTVLTVVTATSLLESGVFGSEPATIFVEMMCVFLLWGPIAVGAVGSPNRWIQRMSPGVGEVRNVYDDPRMVRFENGVVFLAAASALLLTVAGTLFIISRGFGIESQILLGMLGGTALFWAYTKFFWWKGHLRRTPRSFMEMLRVGAH